MTTPPFHEDWRFEVVPASDVSLEDVRWLDQGLGAEIASGESLSAMLTAIAEGKALLWRYTSPEARGVILTETLGDSSTLNVWIISGRGFIAETGRLVTCLDTIARANGLRHIRSLSNRGMARVLQRRGGFALEGYAMRREVPLG